MNLLFILKNHLTKIHETCVKRYGVEYPLQCEHIREKAIETCRQNLGVDYQLQSEEIKKYLQTEEIKNKIDNKDDLKAISEALLSRDLGNFKQMVYIPKVSAKLNEFIYTKEDFFDGGKAESIGDDAVKLLYIPPFALSLSIIALLLNMVTVINMIMIASNRVPKAKMLIVRVALFALIAFLPTITMHDGLDNELVTKVPSENLNMYLKFLNWVSFYEQLNSSLHK